MKESILSNSFKNDDKSDDNGIGSTTKVKENETYFNSESISNLNDSFISETASISDKNSIFSSQPIKNTFEPDYSSEIDSTLVETKGSIPDSSYKDNFRN